MELHATPWRLERISEIHQSENHIGAYPVKYGSRLGNFFCISCDIQIKNSGCPDMIIGNTFCTFLDLNWVLYWAIMIHVHYEKFS